MKEDNLYYLVSQNIKKQRKLKGWTQRELAEKLYVSESFISKLESVTYQTIAIDTLEQIAKLLDTSIKNFFDE